MNDECPQCRCRAQRGRSSLRSLALLATLITLVPSIAQTDAKKAAADGAKPDRAALERQFAEMLEDVVLVGNWQMTGPEGLAGKALLVPSKPEKYTIDGAGKDDGDYWVFRCRIQFNEVDVTVPLRLRVIWAEDTPIVTLDEMPIPGVGTYSARVMMHRNFYAGTWFGSDYGGILSGQILKREVYEKLAPPEKTAVSSD